jgi:hypothetical protein
MGIGYGQHWVLSGVMARAIPGRNSCSYRCMTHQKKKTSQGPHRSMVLRSDAIFTDRARTTMKLWTPPR